MLSNYSPIKDSDAVAEQLTNLICQLASKDEFTEPTGALQSSHIVRCLMERLSQTQSDEYNDRCRELVVRKL